MKLLETILTTPLVHALGWMLLHSLWQGAVVAAGLGAVLVSARSARVRYAAACVAMLAMLACLGLTLVRFMRDAGPPAATSYLTVASTQPSATASDLSSAYPSLASVVPWLVPFWLGGVWIFAMRQIAGWFAASRLRRRGVCAPPSPWQQEITRLRERLRVSRPVLLLESCLAETPVVIGHFRPVILMPIGLFAGLSPAQVESILLHELAHVRRCDYLVNLLQRSVECLLFYHPAVWWISRIIQTERENCCDDVVASTFGDVHEYAVALTALEENRWSNRQPSLAATGGSLVKRIHRLLYPAAARRACSPVFAFLILIGTATVCFAAWTAHGAQQAGVDQQAQASATAYQNWLNEDVVYIISDQERSNFLSLNTDQARDEFIQQFWERHNPNPGMAANLFKEEHYRRIAYANQHFAGSVPGWKSDRGRIYIEFGPPDEIDAHPGAAPPNEVWLYRSGQTEPKVFTFVDVSGKGLMLDDGPRKTWLRISSNVAMASLISRADPPYPDIAKAARISGDVILEILINKQGKVTAIRAKSGPPMLYQAALDAVRQWQFKPFMVNGEPVEVATEITVPFQLE